MFKIFENRKFVKEEGNITYVGLQLRFFGLPIASPYYVVSDEQLKDGFIKRKEYSFGRKNLISTEGVFDKNGRPVGTFHHYTNTPRSYTKFDSFLSKEIEYDDKGADKKTTLYHSKTDKSVYYYDKKGTFCEEKYTNGELYFRKKFRGDFIDYESISSKNDIIHRVVRTLDKRSCFCSEVREKTDLDGNLISRTTHLPTSISNIFFEKEETKGKNTYALIKRNISSFHFNEANYPCDSIRLATSNSQKDIYKIFVEILSIQKEENSERQKAIAHLRQVSTLRERKNVVLAFRAMKRIR